MHKNFHQFKAKDNFELGFLMGQKFADNAKKAISESSVWENWKTKMELAKKFLKFNQDYFPEYVEEIRGYAKGANVDFLDLYTLSLEDEVNHPYEADRCTTLITNNGKLISHNEDLEKWSEDKICIVEKQVRDLKILELYYYNTLGGNSVSINSHGFITCINSLTSKDTSIGLSKNVISRWLSETKNPEKDFEKLKEIPRSVGYSANIIKYGENTDGSSGRIVGASVGARIWNIEYNSKSAVLTHPTSPFVHTNHYLTNLSGSEANTNKNGTFSRYKVAIEKIKDKMSLEEIQSLTNDQTDGAELSIMNERTIAKIIIDLSKSEVGPPPNKAKIWLLRESELGFVDYDISFNAELNA